MWHDYCRYASTLGVSLPSLTRRYCWGKRAATKNANDLASMLTSDNPHDID